MAKGISKKEMWSQVRARLEEIAVELRRKDLQELEKLQDTPYGEELSFGKALVQVNAWAEPHADQRLAVFVDGWRKRFLGWYQSTAVGFLVDAQGNVEEMEDKDFWEHGY